MKHLNPKAAFRLFEHDENTMIKKKNDHRSKFSNLSKWKEEAWKEEAWKNQGLNGIRTRDLRDTGAMFYQLSYEATHWERGQFIEFMKVKSDHRSEFSNLSNWNWEEAWKNQSFNGTNMNYFIYTSHHFTPHGRYELIDLARNVLIVG